MEVTGINDVMSMLDGWAKKDYRKFMKRLADIYIDLVIYNMDELIYRTPPSPN